MNKEEKISRITIILDDRSFEYDVYTLVIAFFQGVSVGVKDPETLSANESAAGLSSAGAEAGSTGSLLIRVSVKEGRITASAETEDTGSLHERCADSPSRDRTEVKNTLKGCVYGLLEELTGRSLPWGNLTGIRPVKLASAFLKEEESRFPDDLKKAVEETAADMQKTYFVSRGKAELAAQIADREQRILDRVRPQKGFSLYIGIPFCPSICLYCSFSSGTLHVWEKETDRYVDTLIHEIEACGQKAPVPCFPGRKLQTVYIGGGTPTTLTAPQMDRLLCALEENFDMEGVLEFTVEAGRPDTITGEKLEVLKKHKVSRISINPQTMNQKTLDLIGRKHTAEDTVRAFRLARSMGFDNINMDLIVGLPGEGLAEVDYTMRELEELDPDDITVHALALKRAARLALHMDEYESISFKASDQIMDRTRKTTRKLGMTPYYLYRQKNMAGNFENVGCARPGKAGIYNILIMEEVQSILAIGASGSTKVILPHGRIERIENVKDVRSYLDRIDEMIARKEILRNPDL